MKKGSKMTEEQRQKVSQAQKKRMANPEERRKFLEHRITPRYWTGKHLPEEERKRISESVKRVVRANKGRLPWIKGKHHTPETLKKMGLIHKGKHPPTEWKKGHKPWIKGRHQSKEARKIMSITKKEGYASGKIMVWNKGKTGVYSKETINKIGEASKKAWANPKVRRKMIEAWREAFVSNPETRIKMRFHRLTQIFPVKDSTPEKKIQGFLKKIKIKFLPHKYIDIKHAYQCDILVPSKNLVIEVDGDYWHGNPKLFADNRLTKRIIEGRKTDRIRTKELQEKGFNVLRLWESEIEKMNLWDFIQKIKPFERK